MRKVEHIGIAVKSLAESIPLFEKLLGISCYKIEPLEREKVSTAFFMVGDVKIELLESTGQGGVIEKFINEKGEGVHHIAFAVENIQDEVNRLKSDGFVIINEEPKAGADNKLINFLHPKSTNNILIELSSDRKG